MRIDPTTAKICVALVLATVNAVISIPHPYDLYDQARFLLLTAAVPQAAAASGATDCNCNPDGIAVPP
jgi:hypothetical protein